MTWDNASKDEKWKNLDSDTKSDKVAEGIVGGGDYNTDPIATANLVEEDQWEEYDITEAMKEIIKNQDTFYGFLLKPYLGNTGRRYYSSDSDEENRPKLTIKYEVVNNIVVNSSKMKMQGILIKNAGNDLKVFVPFDQAFAMTVSDLRGRQVFNVNGSRKSWYTLPTQQMSQGVHVITISAGQQTAFSKFTLMK